MKGRNETMTLEELLKSQGCSDEQVTNILTGMKDNKIYTASEENLDVRYGKLKTEHEAMMKKDGESQKLIEELQEATKGNEGIQSKITEYQGIIEQQKAEIEKAKKESALKIGLLSAGAKADDIDYLLFKMGHDSEFKMELDDNGEIKGLSDKVKDLKVQYPQQFEQSSQKKIEEKKLNDQSNGGGTGMTKAEIMGIKDSAKRQQAIKENYELFTGNGKVE